MIEEQLSGGIAHPGQVVRIGNTVRRPPSKHRAAINALLEHVHETGLLDVPVAHGLDEQGRETFSFIEGDVPIPPYPAWAVTDASLRSVAELLRRYHEAVASFSSEDLEWPAALADPNGGTLVCHNDVCLENVVFRNGKAVGLLDFDFAAPGRRLYDVAMTVRMCGAVRHPANVHPSFGSVDALKRLAIFCRAYGLEAEEGDELVAGMLAAGKTGRAFVKERADAGEPLFLEIWNDEGRFNRDESWVSEHADAIIRTVRAAVEEL